MRPSPSVASSSRAAQAGELARQLAELPVEIERAGARSFVVGVAGWEDGEEGGRPSSRVRVEGAGTWGEGECVAWTVDSQAAFAGSAAALLPRGRHRVGELAVAMRRRSDDPYALAAAQLAVLDLALRQAGTNPFRLVGLRPRPVRFAVSLAVSADPAEAVRTLLAAAPGACVKLDVDPAWSSATLDALEAHAPALVVLDLKLRGDARWARRLHARFPDALLEDPALEPGPPSDEIAAHAAFDAPIQGPEDVQALPVRPAAVNIKPSRMGGFLEALRTVDACARLGIACYVGGMFEVGPGRSQSQVLASLVSADGWNDVAPLPRSARGPWASSPLHVPGDFTGLGFAG